MFDRFTDAARVVMGLCRQEAQRFNHHYIGTEHILLGVLLEGSSAAADLLRGLGADLEPVRAQVDAIVRPGPQVSFSLGQLPFTPRAKTALERAVAEAEGRGQIGPDQLLLGLLEVPEGVAYQALRNLGLEPAKVRAAVLGQAPPAPTVAAESPRGLTARAERTLSLAREEAERLGRDRVGTEHLFLALLRQPDAAPVTVLQKLGVDVDAVRDALIALVRDD